MLNFDFFFLEKRLGLRFQPYFVYDFSRKISLMLYFNNWPNFFVWMPLLLDKLGSMCILIVFCEICDVTNFEINLRFFYMTNKVRTKI